MVSPLADFKKRLDKKEIKIGVVGLGYVGLPLAMAFAKKGFSVTGIDIDRGRIEHIRKKESYISDVTTSELKGALSRKKFCATSNFAALKDIDVILICVPTPLKRKYHPNISYIKQSVKAIAKNIKKGSLVVLESTTYPGTTEEVILPLLEEKELKHGRDFYLCFSPERIDPGNINYPVKKIPKVVGGITPEVTRLASLVYGKIIDKVVPVSCARVAEAVKLLENTFRLINIALIDEMAMMTHQMGIDIWEVIAAAATKPFGFMPFYPGPGVGGHCIPKDPLYLYWKARHHGFRSRFIKLASDVITRMPQYIAERVAAALRKNGKTPKRSKVLVIGATYKKDIKDLRKSPALDIISILQKKNIAVSYHDPLIPYLKLNGIDLKSAMLNRSVLRRFDCVVIATDHSNINYGLILKNSKLIFDSRNVYKGINNEKVVKL
jgi:UDP-N-acetyl-D-glucosamine dehydrogenase